MSTVWLQSLILLKILMIASYSFGEAVPGPFFVVPANSAATCTEEVMFYCIWVCIYIWLLTILQKKCQILEVIVLDQHPGFWLQGFSHIRYFLMVVLRCAPWSRSLDYSESHEWKTAKLTWNCHPSALQKDVNGFYVPSAVPEINHKENTYLSWYFQVQCCGNCLELACEFNWWANYT